MITVDYGDGNGPQEVMLWVSDSMDPNFHDAATNETVNLVLNNPAGATTAQLRFMHLGGNNNWWWAFDNVQVSSVPEPSSCLLAMFLTSMVGLTVRRRRQA